MVRYKNLLALSEKISKQTVISHKMQTTQRDRNVTASIKKDICLIMCSFLGKGSYQKIISMKFPF